MNHVTPPLPFRTPLRSIGAMTIEIIRAPGNRLRNVEDPVLPDRIRQVVTVLVEG